MTTRFNNIKIASFKLLLLCAFFPAHSFAEGIGEGVASLIAASYPIVFSAMSASQAVSQAESAAATAVFQTQTAADVSRYQSDNLRDTTIFQTIVSAQVAESNNKYATQRLQMQLNEMHSSFQQGLDLHRDEFRTNMNYKYQQLALQEKQVDKQLQLDRLNAKNAQVQAGISSGFNDVGSLASNPSTSRDSARAIKNPSLRLRNEAFQIGQDKAIKSSFIARNLASGSTRVRKNVTSDLSMFKNTLPGRSFTADNGFARHAGRSIASSSPSVPFRVHGPSNQ